ncbi:TetR/AcrR family transcriptional regulator [Delftia sp.]|uniref:TetR/AcrR family transcriptional regulator n=1 Tax=Delftia sp. TaxID=1886637 RepID=UPI00259D12C6|nr:TetR/AcrR family transcriptional regulator [Delftia sp.]
MTKTTRRPSSRDKILDAATALVSERGVQQLTIEAAAAAAGVTKAGLIYHFKTRDELLVAVVESMARTIDLYSRAAEEQRASRVNDASAGAKANCSPP